MTQQNNYINFNKKTVFVVGAGASLPYGYPLGADLVNKILEKKAPQGDKSINQLQNLIKFHDPLSIDSFLAQHCAGEKNKVLRNIGKQLIAECILECEDRDAILEKSKQFIYNQETKKYDKRCNENWYRYLEHSMFEDKDRLINKPLPFKIITFNYDVSLDYYLIERVWQATMLNDDQKREILKKLKNAIIHVYGVVRDVPWDNPEIIRNCYRKNDNVYYIVKLNQKSFNETQNQEYEEELTPFIYGSHHETFQSFYSSSESKINISKTEHGKNFIQQNLMNIKVINEEREQVTQDLYIYKQYIAEEAQRIMFLGFGFDNTNMNLLFDEETIKSASQNCKELCYTNYGDSEKLNRRIENYFPKEYFKHFKSTKGVYEALTQDFDLD